MKIFTPAFNVCEEILDFLHHNSKKTSFEEKNIIEGIGKTPAYTKRALNFLLSLGLVDNHEKIISLSVEAEKKLNLNITSSVVIKKQMTSNKLFKEYYSFISKGKSEKQAANYIIATNGLSIKNDLLIKSFNSWTNYLKKEIKDNSPSQTSIVNGNNNFMWIDDSGHLIYDQQSHSDFILEQLKRESGKIGDGSVFVDPNRITELKGIKNFNFDLSKLIRKCEELNIAYSTECYFSVGMLIRAVIDHVPPIFIKKNFSEVTGGHGTRSFQESMTHLDKSSRKISDSMLHTQIREKEILPSKTQVNYSSDLDVLLAEIIRILK
jgi:hypothetical protein